KTRPPPPSSGPWTASSTTRPTASAGRGCGWIWPDMPTRPDSAPIRYGPTSGPTATGSSTPSTATSPLTGSPSSRSPATCCRQRPARREPGHAGGDSGGRGQGQGDRRADRSLAGEGGDVHADAGRRPGQVGVEPASRRRGRAEGPAHGNLDDPRSIGRPADEI